MCVNKIKLLNPKIVVVGVVAAFAIIVGVVGFSGSTIIQANSSAIQHALNYEERE